MIDLVPGRSVVDTVDGSRLPIARRSLPDRIASVRIGVIDGAALACALWAVAMATGIRGPVIGALAGITIATMPGLLVLDRLRPAHRAMSVVLTLGISVATWMLVAHLLLSMRWWPPHALVVVVATTMVVAALRHRRSDIAAGRVTQRPVAVLRRALDVGWPTAAALVAALALWGWSLPQIDLDALGDWGFVTVAPITWFVALGLGVLVVAAAIAPPHVADAQRRARRVAAGLGVVLTVLYATFPAITETIRYPWSYKHLGVIRLLDATGRLQPEIDIYNTFSGMFGLGALVSSTTGVDPASYAAWAQFVGSACIALAVWTLVHRLGRSDRVAHLATALYVLTDWVGQNYFAPQMVGWFFGLVVVALALEWFARPTDGLGVTLRRQRLWAVVLVFVGLLMTHPLTPAAVLLVIGLAVVSRQVRSWTLLAALGAAIGVWAMRSLPYFVSRGFDLGFGGSVTANASGNVDAEQPPPVVALVGLITRGFSVAVWALAALGLVVGLIRRRRIGAAAVTAFAPFVILGAQSYGGEAIYRVFLYSLPGMTALIAIGFAGGRTGPATAAIAAPVWRQRLGATALTVTLMATAAGFVVVHYGREEINLVEAQEVAIADLLEARPEPLFIGAQFSNRFPAASTVRYPMIQVDDTWTPTLDDLLDADSPVPLARQVDDAATWMSGLTEGTVYVIVTPGMLAGVRVLGHLPITTAAEAAALLEASDRYEVVARVEDSWLFRVVPEPSPPETRRRDTRP